MTIFSINGTNLFPVKVKNGNIIPLTIDFTGISNEEIIDLTIPQQGGLFGTLTTVFVDNSSNPNQVEVVISGTGQTFFTPAYSCGFYNIAATGSSIVTMSSSGGASMINNIQLFDYYLAPNVWLTEPAGSGLPITAPDGSIVTLGSKNDAAITNPALSATLIALTKGLLTEAVATVTGLASVVTATNAVKTAVDLTTTAVNAVKTSVDSVVTNTATLVAGLASLVTETTATAGSTATTATNTGPFSYTGITTNTTTVVKNSPGTFGGIVVNTVGLVGTIIVYDNTAGSGSKIATFDATVAGSFQYGRGVTAATGITVVTSSSPDITILWK